MTTSGFAPASFETRDDRMAWTLRRVAARRRLARITAPPKARRRPDLAKLGGFAIGAATAAVVDGWWGLALAAPAALVGHRAIRRLESAEAKERRLREEADAPICADLIAAALRAGAPVDVAVLGVAEALGGPLRERLTTVARSLRLGAEPDEAWSHVAGMPGGTRIAAAAVRSSASGSALAGALTRLADDLRADRAAAMEAAARRAGVLIVLPLGLCFLPAFVLAGLIPVIVALLGDVL
ncbi:Flp pilus assembly protein TadB [Asanoa ferruginea]|uniref:Flp pilus assembly protein TadB n=1 Tax=Asanoa ferruginea TaxID=53367 RepID=A0A3D9ZE76_9ACTN|nr:type II secretion system F family protein [Asanoa ferruginea]REF95728.1 Flp pilus assembly protein TadB [Asanoa ferruginea]GIF53296.1 membrane protein [Asanoa ferruginea]